MKRRPARAVAILVESPCSRTSRSPADPLFLGLGGEQQRVALGPAGVGGAGRLGLGNVLGEDGNHAYAEPVRGDHDLVGLILGHAEFRLQDRDDEFPRREVVVDQDDLVQAGAPGLWLYLWFWLVGGRGSAIVHSRRLPDQVARINTSRPPRKRA